MAYISLTLQVKEVHHLYHLIVSYLTHYIIDRYYRPIRPSKDQEQLILVCVTCLHFKSQPGEISALPITQRACVVLG